MRITREENPSSLISSSLSTALATSIPSYPPSPLARPDFHTPFSSLQNLTPSYIAQNLYQTKAILHFTQVNKSNYSKNYHHNIMTTQEQKTPTTVSSQFTHAFVWFGEESKCTAWWEKAHSAARHSFRLPQRESALHMINGIRQDRRYLLHDPKLIPPCPSQVQTSQAAWESIQHAGLLGWDFWLLPRGKLVIANFNSANSLLLWAICTIYRFVISSKLYGKEHIMQSKHTPSSVFVIRRMPETNVCSSSDEDYSTSMKWK